MDLSALDPELRRQIAAGGVALAWAAFTGLILGREALRRRARQREAAALATGPGAPVLVAYASQTGFAEELARTTARALTTAGTPVTLRDLSAVTAADLAGAGRALFLVSTTGEGDAPDPARAFIRDVMATTPDLSGLSHAVLALGDSSYAQFCAFGRSLDAWLAGRGAQALFDRIEVDDGDDAALQLWQASLAGLSGSTELTDWSRPAYGQWALTERRLLNPGSPGGEAWHIRLEPQDGAATWQAGDLVEIAPQRDPAARETGLPHRDYSIASLPEDGGIELIVRLQVDTGGRPGLGSGWLCRLAEVGQPLEARVRSNRSFHTPPGDAPLILIGAGTGLAGLRAHLKARAAAGQGRNWLIFGERTAAHDFLHRAEIEHWQASGVLQRLDLAFSRDQDQRIYVQHRLREAAAPLRAWVAEGASIMVCGSMDGMGREVHAALAEILGVETLERLTDAGRYRRDVY